MYSVSDDEVEYILNDIEKRGVTTEDVRYNILDHVCCIIENEFNGEKDFKKFYENTIARFYKKELSEIERETENLLTFKYYFAMKRTLKISGLISILFIVVGSILKAQHLPGAGVLLVLGFTIFSFVFIPLNIVMKFRDDQLKSNRLVMSLGLLLTLTGTIGLLFKVMHWPGANVLFYGSLALFGLVFIPLYAITSYRNPETRFNGMILTTFMIAAAGMLFAMIDMRPSIHVEESIISLDVYQMKNIKHLKESNQIIYTELKKDSSTNEIQQVSANLIAKIDSIQANLIAKINNEQLNQSIGKGLAEVKNNNDVKVIIDYFQISKDPYSHHQLKKEIQVYNNAIEALDSNSILRPINIDNLQMKNTVFSVIHFGLIEIKLQVLSNENSYLCLKKGDLDNN